MDLATGARTSVGPARLIGFSDSGHVAVVAPDSNHWFLIDSATGAKVSSPYVDFSYFRTNPSPFPPHGYVIDPRVQPAPTFEATQSRMQLPEQRS